MTPINPYSGMRASIVAGVLVATTARADLAPDAPGPGIAYRCAAGKRWDDVAACMGMHGNVVVLKTLGDAKLVRLDQQEQARWVDAGVYLFRHRKGAWKLAGVFFGRGSDYEVELAPIVVAGKAGYRIDIAQITPTVISLDGITTRTALRRAFTSLYCGGSHHACAEALRSCEVLVDGNAYWTFRGTVKLDGSDVIIAGDRRHAGPYCAPAVVPVLDWDS